MNTDYLQLLSSRQVFFTHSKYPVKNIRSITYLHLSRQQQLKSNNKTKTADCHT